MKREVVIAGAGPAGAVTALLLARRGYRVTVLDRARFPRSKVCGEYQSPALPALFGRLGLRREMEARSRARIHGLRITGPGRGARNGESLAAPYPEGGYGLGLERRVLDQILLEGARQAGAEILEGVLVTGVLERRGRVAGLRARSPRTGRSWRFRAPWTVGAEGRHSVVARELGLRQPARFPRRFALSSHMGGVEGLGRFGEMHVFDGGYCGVAPLGADVANISAVVPARRLGEVRRQGPERFLRTLLGGHPLLGERTAAAGFRGPVALLGPLAYGARRRIAPGALLVGDAAGFLDPFTGEGMYRAMHAAELAAECLDDALAGRVEISAGLLRAYEERYHGTFRRKDVMIRALGRVTARPWLAAVAGWVLGRRPGLVHDIVAVAGDCLPPDRLLSITGLGRHLWGEGGAVLEQAGEEGVR